MIYKNIHNLVIEGPDGVGKTTLIKGLFKHYNYRYMCYHRGEISNKFYANKFNRPYYVTQNKLPFLYIVLLCDDEEELRRRILSRTYESEEEKQQEVEKVKDNQLFRKTAEEMQNDYDIVIFDTSTLNEEQVLNQVCEYLDKRFIAIEKDTELNQWNKMYKKGCEVLNKNFDVIDNQPYIDGYPANCETTLHNGAYETFTNKTVPNNLIFTLGYGELNVNSEKKFDFQYVINSKINRRPEVFDYYKKFEEAGKSILTSNYEGIPEYKNSERLDRVFGVDFLKALSQAKATVYSAREVEHLKIQTGRLYEAIIANNIVFVDKESDKDCEILSQIYDDDALINLLYVTPDTIIDNYNKIINNEKLYLTILARQHKFLENLIERLRNK